MAFQQSTIQRQSAQPIQTAQSIHSALQQQPQPSDSQEWILFAPGSQAESSTNRTDITQTAGLSRASELGYLNSAVRSGQPGSSILDDDATEDAELDSLDDGLHAFREPILYPTATHQTNGPVLPAHDGLGSFQASSAPVLEQLWQHEQFNSKRKHAGHHRRSSSVQRHLDTVDEFEAQASEEKRLRIEKWRIEQSQALLEEVEKETRRRTRSSPTHPASIGASVADIFGTTPKQSDYMPTTKSPPILSVQEEPENEPFWRRITRKFIRDIIGIDDPLLSVILGESLPGEQTPRATSPVPEASSQSTDVEEESISDVSWRDKLLQRIAHELGVFPSQLTPHPGAFTTYTNHNADYAGMPVSTLKRSSSTQSTMNTLPTMPSFASSLGPNFPPTLRDDGHAECWGFEEEPSTSHLDSSLNLRREREYWEKELDVKMVFRYLKDRFASTPAGQPHQPQHTQPFRKDDSAHRAAIIRQHHPLVNRAHRSPTRARRDSRLLAKRPSSSCASESLKGSRKASALRSGSSRNYWDIGGSAGSGSIIASGGMIGGWGQA